MARDDDPPPAKRPRADCTGTSSNGGEPPPAKRPRSNCTGTSSTSIHSLHMDLLLDIFPPPRLPLGSRPSPPAPAGGWRDEVTSSPVFRRQFIKRHPAPLLGLFFDPPSPDVPAIPSFAPARGEDPMLTTILLSGEFLRTNLQRRGRVAEPRWSVLDARGSYLLLVNFDERLLALLNPLARPYQRIFYLDYARIFDDNHIGRRAIFHAGVILHDENPERFDIFCLAVQGEFRLRAAIFSAPQSSVPGIGGGWILSTWLEVPPHPLPLLEIDDVLWLWLESGMRVGNFIYWPYRNREHVVVLDPTDRVAPRLWILMVRGADGMDAGTWATVDEFDLTEEILHLLGRFPEDHDQLELVAMRGSIVYFTISQMYHPSENPCWFMSLCLETGERERLFARAYDAFFQPYHHLV
ncbi:hypothetical protein ACQ4PT_025463 [Festuca glaucescens]